MILSPDRLERLRINLECPDYLDNAIGIIAENLVDGRAVLQLLPDVVSDIPVIWRSRFTAFNRKRRQAGTQVLTFEEYLENWKKRLTPDGTYVKKRWQSFNIKRRAANRPELTFEQYKTGLTEKKSLICSM